MGLRGRDRAYEGENTRQLALDLNFIPVVPPKSNRLNAWQHDRAMYKRRNEIDSFCSCTSRDGANVSEGSLRATNHDPWNDAFWRIAVSSTASA
jgi:hypothetical protein